MSLITLNDLRAAQQRLDGIAARTPLVRMSLAPGSGLLWLKAESLQPIGSFKLRGAYNKIAQFTPLELSRGLITYSSGNHGQGVAYTAREIKTKAIVVMPASAPETKRRATADLGAEIVLVGSSSSERTAKAEQLAEKFGYVIVPPYDDPAIIAGQGTCGLEIVDQMPEADVILAPVGGGGLLSGIAAAVKLSRPKIKVFGVEPELAGDAAESMRAGRRVAWDAEALTETIADGLRAQSIGALNFTHLQAYVDGIVTVTEREIRESMRRILFGARLVAEPSGAVAAAAALFHHARLGSPARIVAVVSGGNVEPEVLSSVLAGVE